MAHLHGDWSQQQLLGRSLSQNACHLVILLAACSCGEDVGFEIFGVLVFSDSDARCPRSDFASAFAGQSRSVVLRHLISSQSDHLI